MIAILLGLTAGVGWGISDFMAGLSGRRASPLMVGLFTQFAGLAVVCREAMPLGDSALRIDLAGVGALALLGSTILAGLALRAARRARRGAAAGLLLLTSLLALAVIATPSWSVSSRASRFSTRTIRSAS